MSEVAVEVSGVGKTYGERVEALRGVDLTVPVGAVFGLLGPNGAGKSTLIKILTTIIKPTRGRGTLLGAPLGSKSTLARVGYLPEHARFPGYLTGRQVIEYSAGLAGISPRASRPRCEELLETVAMTDWASKKVKTYSKGMKQRIGLAQALVNNPDLVFLDEPTDGVDPGGRLELLQLVKRMRDEGRTIFINTHLLSELESVADHIAIMNQGQIARVGLLAELILARPSCEVVTVGSIPEECRVEIENAGGSVMENTIVIDGESRAALQQIIDLLRQADCDIVSVTPKQLTLQELFLEATTAADSKTTFAR